LARRDGVGIFDVKRKILQVILVTAISLAIPVSSAYTGYYTVASADFLSPNLGFEAFDQEYLAAANQGGFKIFDSSTFFKRLQPGIYSFELFPHSSSDIPSLDQNTLVLRC